jgi:hypothetical protein
MFSRQIYHSPTPQKSLQTPRHLLRERQITVIKPLNLFNVRNQLMQIKKIDTVKADAQLEVDACFG